MLTQLHKILHTLFNIVSLYRYGGSFCCCYLIVFIVSVLLTSYFKFHWNMPYTTVIKKILLIDLLWNWHIGRGPYDNRRTNVNGVYTSCNRVLQLVQKRVSDCLLTPNIVLHHSTSITRSVSLNIYFILKRQSGIDSVDFNAVYFPIVTLIRLPGCWTWINH